jgi:hypothetical protein
LAARSVPLRDCRGQTDGHELQYSAHHLNVAST